MSHGTSPQADLLLDRCSSSPRLTPASAERRCCPYPSLAFVSHDRLSQKISKDYKRTHAIQYLPNFSSIESSPLGSSTCPVDSRGTSPHADHVLERSSYCPPRLSPSSAKRERFKDIPRLINRLEVLSRHFKSQFLACHLEISWTLKKTRRSWQDLLFRHHLIKARPQSGIILLLFSEAQARM